MSRATDQQVLVIDNGTGFTKMGYSGNAEPTFIVPTAVALADAAGAGGAGAGAGAGTGGAARAGGDGIADLDFFAGEEVRGEVGGERLCFHAGGAPSRRPCAARSCPPPPPALSQFAAPVGPARSGCESRHATPPAG